MLRRMTPHHPIRPAGPGDAATMARVHVTVRRDTCMGLLPNFAARHRPMRTTAMDGAPAAGLRRVWDGPAALRPEALCDGGA